MQTISSSETAAHLVFPEEQFLVARAHDGDDMVAGSLQVAGDGVHRCDAHAACHAHHRAVVFDLGGVAQRPGDGVEAIADVHGAHLHRGLAHFLEDQRDRAGDRVVVGDGERDALPLLIGDDDDKLTRLRVARDVRRFDDHQLGHVAENLFFENLVHGFPYSAQ